MDSDSLGRRKIVAPSANNHRGVTPVLGRLWLTAVTALSGAIGLLVNRSEEAAIVLVGATLLGLALGFRPRAVFSLAMILLAFGISLHGFLVYALGFPAVWKEVALVVAGVAGAMSSVRGRAVIPSSLALTPLLVALLSLLLVGGRPAGLVPLLQIALGFPIGYALCDTSARLRKLLVVGIVAGLFANGLAVALGSVAGSTVVDYPGVEMTVGQSVRPGGLAGTNLVTASLLGLGLAALMPAVTGRRVLRVRTVATVSVAAAVALLGLVASGARAPLVAVLAGGAYLLLRLRGAQRRSLAVASAAGLLALAGALTVAYAFEFQGALAARVDDLEALRASDSLRVDRWVHAVQYFLESPIAGNGPGSTGLAAVREHIGRSAAYFPSDLPVPVTESSVLKVAAELGILGMLAMAAIVAESFRRLRPSETLSSFAAGATLAAIVGQGLVFQNLEVYFIPPLVGAVFGFAVRADTPGRLGAVNQLDASS